MDKVELEKYLTYLTRRNSSGVHRYWVSWFFYKELNKFFDSILLKYIEGRPKVLEKAKSTNRLRLADVLKNLWLGNIELPNWNDVWWTRRQLGPEAAQVLVDFLNLFEQFFLSSNKREEAKRELLECADEYERFWFKKKHYEELLEIFSKEGPGQLEDVFKKSFDSLRSHILEGNKDLSVKKKIEKAAEELAKKIEEGNNRFIDDLKTAREDVKNNLRGKFYWLKVGINFSLKYVPLLTFVVLVFDLQAPDEFNKWVVSVVSDFFRCLFG